MKVPITIRRLIGYLTGTQWVDRVIGTGDGGGPLQISAMEDPDLWEDNEPVDLESAKEVMKKILISEVNGAFEASGAFKDYVRFVRF